MQAIELNANITVNNEIYLKLPHNTNATTAKVIVLINENNKLHVKRKPRQPGYLKNKIVIHEDFNAPMSEEELALWYDSPIFPIN